MPGFIDAHVHVWTDDTDHYPLAKGFTKADMKPATFPPEELFKHGGYTADTSFGLHGGYVYGGAHGRGRGS
jgi:hypothetical protein